MEKASKASKVGANLEMFGRGNDRKRGKKITCGCGYINTGKKVVILHL